MVPGLPAELEEPDRPSRVRRGPAQDRKELLGGQMVRA